MKPSELVWTFVLSFAGILGINMVIRVAVNGMDAAMNFSWLGSAIAAGIAALVTYRSAQREPKSRPETPDADGQS